MCLRKSWFYPVHLVGYHLLFHLGSGSLAFFYLKYMSDQRTHFLTTKQLFVDFFNSLVGGERCNYDVGPVR